MSSVVVPSRKIGATKDMGIKPIYMSDHDLRQAIDQAKKEKAQEVTLPQIKEFVRS